MSDSFSMEIKKHKTTTIGQVEGHNDRLHTTKSQLPESAWITPEGKHVITAFKHELISQSKKLMVRHDNVIAVELVLQVGNQTDWRELPTSEFPEGKPKPGASKRLNALMKGAKEAAYAEFGKDRIVSMVMHTDESTPHIHIVFVPIVEGKLNAKSWLNGPKSCAIILKKLHGHMEKFIPCSYTPGAPGGEPHDHSKGAGKENGPKPEKKKNLFEKAADALNSLDEIKALKSSIAELNQHLQTMFSKLKKAEKVALDEGEKRKNAEEKAAAAELAERKARRVIVVLEREIERLTPYAPKDKEKPLKTASDGLPERLKSPENTQKHPKLR